MGLVRFNFLQIPTPFVDQWVLSHPVLSTGSILLLLGLVLGILKILLGRTESRINEKFQAAEDTDKRHDESLEKLGESLKRHEQEAAVGTKETAIIHESLKNITSELRGLSDSFGEFTVVNERSHAVLGERLAKLESQLPNGELKKLADAFEKLSKSRAKRA